jgi:hypothetical protein
VPRSACYGVCLHFQVVGEELPTFGVELPVLALLIVVSALSIAGTVAFIVVGSRFTGAVTRLEFPKGIPPSTAGSSTFSADELIAAQARAYRIPADVPEDELVRIRVARIQPIRPQILYYRSAYELAARGIAMKLIVQEMGDNSTDHGPDALTTRTAVYTTRSLVPLMPEMTKITGFERHVPDRVGSFRHTPTSPIRYAYLLYVLKGEIEAVFTILRDHKVVLDATAHPTEAWWVPYA